MLRQGDDFLKKLLAILFFSAVSIGLLRLLPAALRPPEAGDKPFVILRVWNADGEPAVRSWLRGQANAYERETGRRVIFEYALSDGVNAGEAQARELAELLRGMQCHVNLIPLNTVEERDMRGVTEENVQRFLKILQERGISATRRREMGDDIEGACGQLRRKTINGSGGE